MTSYLIFGRHEYAEPLEHIGDIDWDGVPSLDDLNTGTDWLELVLIPADEIIWIQRDGELVRKQAEVTA